MVACGVEFEEDKKKERFKMKKKIVGKWLGKHWVFLTNKNARPNSS